MSVFTSLSWASGGLLQQYSGTKDVCGDSKGHTADALIHRQTTSNADSNNTGYLQQRSAGKSGDGKTTACPRTSTSAS